MPNDFFGFKLFQPVNKMIKKTYSEKLKDPRWQKKRLEILQRDNWECKGCGDTESTLHVHHKLYAGEPWEVESKHLITLCKECHDNEEYEKSDVTNNIIKLIQSSPFLFSQISYFTNNLPNTKISDEVGLHSLLDVLTEIILNPELQKLVNDTVSNYLTSISSDDSLDEDDFLPF